MIAEFKRAESAMDGGFYQMGEEYENWLEKLQLAEAGLALPEGFVPYIQYVSFDETGQAVGFLNHACDSMTSCSSREDTWTED
jgi:predicted acetyltransferase